MKHRLTIAGLAASLLAAGVAASCGTSHPTVSAPLLLRRTQATLDASHAVHFTLTSSDVDLTGTNIVNGHGDLVRPDGLQGTFGVSLDGFTANVAVVSVGGVFEAKTPFSTSFVKTDPSKFGLKDPAQLLDPQTGLVRLLTLATNPKLGPSERVSGELLDTVSYDVPGDDIPVLPDENPSQPVHLTVAINPSSDQLRTVTLAGPFTSATKNSTYVVTLTNYDEHVTVTLPSSG